MSIGIRTRVPRLFQRGGPALPNFGRMNRRPLPVTVVHHPNPEISGQLRVERGLSVRLVFPGSNAIRPLWVAEGESIDLQTRGAGTLNLKNNNGDGLVITDGFSDQTESRGVSLTDSRFGFTVDGREVVLAGQSLQMLTGGDTCIRVEVREKPVPRQNTQSSMVPQRFTGSDFQHGQSAIDSSTLVFPNFSKVRKMGRLDAEASDLRFCSDEQIDLFWKTVIKINGLEYQTNLLKGSRKHLPINLMTVSWGVGVAGIGVGGLVSFYAPMFQSIATNLVYVGVLAILTALLVRRDFNRTAKVETELADAKKEMQRLIRSMTPGQLARLKHEKMFPPLQDYSRQFIPDENRG